MTNSVYCIFFRCLKSARRTLRLTTKVFMFLMSFGHFMFNKKVRFLNKNLKVHCFQLSIPFSLDFPCPGFVQRTYDRAWIPITVNISWWNIVVKYLKPTNTRGIHKLMQWNDFRLIQESMILNILLHSILWFKTYTYTKTVRFFDA